MTPRVLIVAGGTGGHIFPGLAVAAAIKEKGGTVFWLGAQHGLESDLVPAEYSLEQVNIRGIRNTGWKQKLYFPWRMLWATIQAYRIIRRLQPDVVLTMGGYVAGPGGLAAFLARKKLIIHEQNAKAGLTNRILARLAAVRLQAFEGAFRFPGAITVGNPVRAALQAIAPPEVRYAARIPNLFRVLVLGGSQGAKAINHAVLAAWRVYGDLSCVQVWHQTGKADYGEVYAAYVNWPLNDMRVDAFIDDMVAAYEFADLIICRAGAMTVSEIAAVGVAAIWIPYPTAADNHQYFNARSLTDQDAGILLPQTELSGERLCALIRQVMHDPTYLCNMAEAAKKQAKPDATTRIVDFCFAPVPHERATKC